MAQQQFIIAIPFINDSLTLRGSLSLNETRRLSVDTSLNPGPYHPRGGTWPYFHKKVRKLNRGVE